MNEAKLLTQSHWIDYNSPKNESLYTFMHTTVLDISKMWLNAVPLNNHSLSCRMIIHRFLCMVTNLSIETTLLNLRTLKRQLYPLWVYFHVGNINVLIDIKLNTKVLPMIFKRNYVKRGQILCILQELPLEWRMPIASEKIWN